MLTLVHDADDEWQTTTTVDKVIPIYMSFLLRQATQKGDDY